MVCIAVMQQVFGNLLFNTKIIIKINLTVTHVTCKKDDR